MIILYFALLGLIWLPRWTSPITLTAHPPTLPHALKYLNSSFATANKKLFSDIFYQSPRKQLTKPPLLNIELTDTKRCFTCPLKAPVKQCGTSFYAHMLFGLSNYPLSKDFGIFTHEPYPCYSKSSKAGSCVMNIEGVNTAPDVLPGAACSVCNSCSKSTMNQNLSLSSVPRKHFYMPKFTFQISNNKKRRNNNEKIFVHCINSLIYIKFESIDQFCDSVDKQLSAYSYQDQESRITVVSTCKDFCKESRNIITRELYSSEIGVYLIIVAMICSMIVCVLYTIDYVLSLWRELGVLNVSWDDANAICPICMDTLYRFVRVATLPCGHSFCRSCLHQWLHTFYHITCPLCRQPVDPNASTTGSNVPPPMLMLTDNTIEDEEEEEEEEVISDVSSHSILYSIYNMGSNIVSRWSNPNPISTDVIYTSHPPTTTVYPIPLPHYSLSTVSPLRSTSLQQLRSGSSLQQVYSAPIVLPYNSSHSLLADSSAHSFSDSELNNLTNSLNSVPMAVQDRIARKLNRTRQKREKRLRRSRSTSDVTSATSATSESESDYSTHRY